MLNTDITTCNLAAFTTMQQQAKLQQAGISCQMFHALTFDGLNGIMTKKNLDIRAGYRKREYDTRKVYLGTV